MSDPKPKKRRRRRTMPVMRELVQELAQVVINIRCVVADLRHIVAELQAVRPRRAKQQRSASDSRQASLFENSLSPAENVDSKPNQPQPK